MSAIEADGIGLGLAHDRVRPVRPELARWAAAAGILANVVLIGAFFLNWSWQLQLGAVAPFGLVWLAGWWRWQRSLDRYEVAVLGFRAQDARVEAERHATALARGYPRACKQSSEDWLFELRYQKRRAEERAAEASDELAELRKRQAASRWRVPGRG